MLNWNQKSNLVLIGMPSSGKSTLGKIIAKKFGLNFVDTDHLIEQHAGSSLQHIVNARGLKNFRRIEAQVVSGLELENHVISTGGSVIYSDRAMAQLAQSGCIVYLRLSLPTMMRRLHNVGSRGLAKLPGDSLHKLYFERQPLYAPWAERTLDNNWPLSAARQEHLLAQLSPDV